MKVLTYQDTPAFCDKEKNLCTIESTCAAAAILGVQTVVFPELFLTGYQVGNQAPLLAEPIDGPSVEQLRRIAHNHKVALICGLIEVSEGTLFNAAVAINAEGETIAHHRKVFLFGDTEKQLFQPGTAFTAFELNGITCGLSICYDIEFPETARCFAHQQVKILFNPTANMMPYLAVPRTLARASALENNMVVVYANLCGHEGNTEYTGLSAIIGPDGEDLIRAGKDPALLMTDLSPALHRGLSTQLQDLALSSISRSWS